jgi:hypothetical protein
MLDMLWNHLWQSTLFGGAAALLALAFRRDRAHVRYWLWLSASVKFLIPFGALLWMGTQIELMPLERSGQAIVGVLDNVAQPFTQPEPSRVNQRGRPVPPPPSHPMLTLAVRGFTIVWPAGSVALLLVWAVRWHRVTRAAHAASTVTSGPLLDTLRRLEGHTSRVRLVSANHAVEPGVFGIVRPVLMWPAGIEDRLTAAQIELSALKRVALGAALVAAIAIPVAIGIITSPRLAAQIVAPGADSPTLDVASIKPNAGGGRVGGMGTPGRVNLTGMSARRLITQAYEIHDSQIIGGPDWLGAQGYDINATLTGTPSPDDRRMMMKTLLRDRFKLTFHTEKRDLPTP